MRIRGRNAAWAIGLSLVLAAGVGTVFACSGKGAVKTTSTGGCTYGQKASGPACSGVVKQAFSGACCPAGASAGAGCNKGLAAQATNVMYTVQLSETKEGFRVSVVGCKVHGRDLLEKSARVLHDAHSLDGEILDAKDGLYLDVQGEAAKGMLHRWQAMGEKEGCLLSTEEGECLIGSDALGAATG